MLIGWYGQLVLGKKNPMLLEVFVLAFAYNVTECQGKNKTFFGAVGPLSIDLSHGSYVSSSSRVQNIIYYLYVLFITFQSLSA